MRLRRGRPGAGRLPGPLVAAAAVAALVAWSAPRTSAQDAPAAGPPPFSATASALGVRAVLHIPGFVATDTPLDGGGPTAQVALDSLGQSSGYAAFPDPGQFAAGLPGLAAGLLSGGAAGLPPIDLPFEMPGYPLAISTQHPLQPEASLGDGPLRLELRSVEDSSVASARGGLRIPGAATTGAVSADASVVEHDGEVVSRAVADVQGIALGPLSLGRVRAVAELVVGPDGDVDTRHDLAIEGLRIGGIAVSLEPEGLDIGGVPVPLPVSAALAPLLDAAGLSLEIVPPPETADGTVATASLRLVKDDIEVPSVGAGTLTITIGSAVASLRAVSPQVDAGVAVPSGPPGTPVDVGTGSVPVGSVGPGPASPAGGGRSPVGPSAALDGAQPATTVLEQPRFDPAGAYLSLLLAAVGVAVVGQVVRLRGVRAPWRAFDAG